MDEQKGIGIPVWCTYTGVFLLFFLCGIGSGAVSFDRFPEGRGIILPLPFAFLSQVLYLRYSVRGVFAMPLMMVSGKFPISSLLEWEWDSPCGFSSF
jgi:zinc transporter ZupT